MRRRKPQSGSWSDAAFAMLPLLFAGALPAGCDPAPGTASAFELRHKLAAARRCHVSVPDKRAAELVSAQLARHSTPGLGFDVAIEGERKSSLGGDPLIWIGKADSPGCEAALARLGVARIHGGFGFLGEDFIGRGDGLIATVPDPARAGAVLEIVLCNDLRALPIWVRDWTPTSRLGWQNFRAGAVHREGLVDSLGGPSLDGGQVDVAAIEAELSKDTQQGELTEFDWIAPPDFDPASEQAWLAELDRSMEGVHRRLAAVTPVDAQWRLTLRLFETPEELARVCRARGMAQLRALDLQAELSLVHVGGAPDNGAFELARAAATISAGWPRAAWLLDAVAGASARTWFGRPSKRWLAYLWSGDLVPSLENLTADDGGLSPHVAGPLRAALLDCCEASKGADFAARQWSAAEETIELPSDEEFRAWLAREISGELEAVRRLREERHAQSLARTARRGACLVPSPPKGDPLSGGFGSRACEKSLARLRQLGASAVALSWCTAIEASEPRVFGAGRETWTQADDAALWSAIQRAKKLGLSVVLLPQLVATENGGWAGQVMLTTHKSQRELFRSWREFLINLGLLAELAEVDVLSLGTESPDTAVTRVSDQNRRSAAELEGLRADWRFLIEVSRGAFAGGLTYAARWDGEAQGIEFWNQLDFLGQNVFPPVGDEQAAASPGAPSVSDIAQRIASSFAHLSDLAKADGVRPLICGIGISSTADGWRQPSRPSGPVDLELQARFYDGLKSALQIGRRQELLPAGLFTWYWWSDPESGGTGDRSFTPQHKPAEAALGRALQVR